MGSHGYPTLFAPLRVGTRTMRNRVLHVPMADPDWVAKALAAEAAAIRRCGCTEATCLRTQLTGSLCGSWPEAAPARGYLGYAV